MNLSGAKVDQEVRMTGARFDGALNASSIEVGGDLSMQSDADNRTIFNDVDPTGAKIKGQLDLSGADFEGALNAETLHVDGNLLMQSDQWRGSSFKAVDISGATVVGNLSLIGASFDGPLFAGLLKVGGNLEMGIADRRKVRVLHPARRISLRIQGQQGQIQTGASDGLQGGGKYLNTQRQLRGRDGRLLLAGRRQYGHAR